ncbi:bifunctional diaminohydroxyphosphoribosylaminopyrimidine deaminase/5-amino-6-(5-phosphoribosylamino)uracil reductase RibD [Sphingomonas sp. IC-56]|uniref:bifunctional diaminohydroxyphosphoribosylaminopyrimidine deaminase/5-amino-6-(5-phosphoribosylamino)uracil reductase RibD n=1 Tax=Sphingomonas sp. IC-56 TaxID=2898529 RepID=UPI001E35751C|nr:bifunctional diaminohydroxyphosphoribosylaminopyrimidine deaminase/5-amino-6-(5-phosphoribosylamino)uracil reductase RibD [Sphingomonas sp. IC-56]MCD2323605.1 bifunctional diaminohydroxyphosphoribosylaminopyrimidine deaminase/5-amino-6-(5-phosphoribosylamino)uracil reductase RibD [Sphingomonas sp. IC-56]
MAAALTLSQRTRGQTAPNPNVGCVLVRDGVVVGRGWTQPGGRPHGEAMALEQAGERARGATCYTTLEPCAHRSYRGPTCSNLLIDAGVARVVIALRDPDPRTDGAGADRLRAAGIEVTTGVLEPEARYAMAGFLTRQAKGRPHVTLKLATSLDGRIALPSGESRWITGSQARAHAHLERARHEAILVGRGTWEIDQPKLDVRLLGLEDRAPRQLILSSSGDLRSPEDIAALDGVDHLLVEGGAQTAAAFLRANLVDRLLLYRAPILLGAGKPALGDIGLPDLASAHGRWSLLDARQLGSDRLEVYASS